MCRIDVGRGSESFVALFLSVLSYARKRTDGTVSPPPAGRGLKHLSRLQWRVDIPYHGRPSRSQGLTTRGVILAENSSRLLTFSRRQTGGSLRDILRIQTLLRIFGVVGPRYKEIEEEKEEFKEWEEVDIATEERKQARVVGRQFCRCQGPGH